MKADVHIHDDHVVLTCGRLRLTMCPRAAVDLGRRLQLTGKHAIAARWAREERAKELAAEAFEQAKKGGE